MEGKLLIMSYIEFEFHIFDDRQTKRLKLFHVHHILSNETIIKPSEQIKISAIKPQHK